ncbi:MAG: PQQ-binding-like beta-propeller repeat protein, partial [Myxococcales bacterium]
FPIVPLANGTRAILTGDQQGYTYAINADTGARLWGGTGGVRVGTSIQAQPAVQLNQYADTAFKAANLNRDLVFFVARESASPRVVALSSTTGATVWTVPTNPSGMGTASGGMMVDYANNVLWIPTRKATGLGGGTLWAFSTLTGLQLGVLDLGDSDYGVNLDFRSNQLYFTANGTSPARVVAVDVNTRTEAWRFNLPATPTTWVFPTGNGFIASLSNGTVARYAVVNNAVVSTPVWTRNVAGPTGITIDYGTQKIYVGSNDGNVYELATADGAVTGQARVSTSGGVGTPTLDSTAGRLHVGTMDGRVCAFRVPF